MNKLHSLAAAVLAVSLGVAAIPALAGQSGMSRQMPENGRGMTMGRMGHGAMGGSMMGHGMMGGGMMGMMGRGMMGSMMAGDCDSMMRSMNGWRPNGQWSWPPSRHDGMSG